MEGTPSPITFSTCSRKWEVVWPVLRRVDGRLFGLCYAGWMGGCLACVTQGGWEVVWPVLRRVDVNSS